MSLLDDRYDPKSAVSKRRREERQEATDANAIGRRPVNWDNLLQVKEELEEVKRWQATATGNNGITINGNVFTGPGIPAPAAQSFTTDILVINPTDTISATSGTTETTTDVSWPNGTACTIDMGAQDDAIAQVGYRVLNNVLYIRWRSMAASGFDVPLNGSNVTITAFLAN